MPKSSSFPSMVRLPMGSSVLDHASMGNEEDNRLQKWLARRGKMSALSLAELESCKQFTFQLGRGPQRCS